MSGLLATTAGPSAYWYLTRGTGTVALLLLTAAVVLGVASSTRWSSTRWPRFVVSGLHRNLTLIAIAFVALHVLTTVADGFAPIGLRDAVVPFVSPYRPFWLGLGAVAFDLLLALVVTSLLRARIGLRLWRGLHWLAYVSWPVALLHALGTGSDARTGWLAALAVGSVAVVAVATGWRVLAAREAAPRLRLAGGAAALIVPLLLVGWYRTGPLRAGWAARAGTPTELLGRRSAPSTTPVAATQTTPAAPVTRAQPPSRFVAPLRGSISESSPDASGLATVSLRAAVRDAAGGLLRLTLRGNPLAGGGVTLDQSAVRLARAGDTYTGRIVGLDGDRVEAALRDRNGRALVLTLALRIDVRTGRLDGVVRGEPLHESEGLQG